MSTIEQLAEVYYPTSDGEPMAETGTHVWRMIDLLPLLRERFKDRTDVYVVGNIFLYHEKGNPSAARSPDVMVIKGVPSTPERDSFKVWEEKAVPCVVIELTSAKTKDEDLGPKKELYQRLGVREYFLFDPKHEYLPRQLMGYRLIAREEESTGENGTVVAEYEELPPDQEGGLVSAELGVRLVPEGERLAVFDYATGERLLPMPERAEQERLRAEDERRQREQAERAAEQQEALRKQAERTAEEERRQREQQETLRREAERTAKQERQQREKAQRTAEQQESLRKEAEQAAERARRRAEEAERAAEQGRQQREEAQRAAEHERLLRRQAEQEAEQKRRQLEQELARLRALLPPEPPADEGTQP
jgi:Uma2 family endonuclease